MRDDICTIPISEVFEHNDGCPICRMYETVNNRILDYIMGDAMMEPDVRIETNKLGFCADHYEEMFSRRGRLAFALMLETHLKNLNSDIFTKNPFSTNGRKADKVKKVSESCFVCDKVEWGISRMIDTIYRTYENQLDFRNMFNSQEMFCLPHYERLINGIDKKQMRKYGKEFADNLTRITSNYAKNLSNDLTAYCAEYNYCQTGGKVNFEKTKDSVERSIAFLSGRVVE